MSNKGRPNSVDSLQVHRPRFSFCEPENPSTPPPAPPPKPPEPPPTIDELLRRARAQRRRAIREENFEFLNRLDADIERLQKAVRQGKGAERSSKILAKSDLQKMLGNLEKEMLRQTKKRIFGPSPLAVDAQNAMERAESGEEEIEKIIGQMRGGDIREYWTNSGAKRLGPENWNGRNISEWETKASELDRILERELGGEEQIWRGRGPIHRRPFGVPISKEPEGIGWMGRRRHSSSFSPTIFRRPPPSPDLHLLNAGSFPILAPEWEKGHLDLLEQIRRFDAEMGIGAVQKPKFALKRPARRMGAIEGRRRPSSASIPPSPPILTKYTANWVRKYGGGSSRPNAGNANSLPPPSPQIHPPAFPSPSISSANSSSPSSSSCWSTESPFAPPKGFHRQRRANKGAHRRRSSPKMPPTFLPDESPRLPTPPELKEDFAQTSSPNSPLLDRQQFLLEINPADRGFASHAVDLFGLETMANIYARDWAERKEGIEQMLRRLRAEKGELAEREMLETAIPVLKRTLQDPLFQVFSAGIELFDYLAGRLSSPPANSRLQRRLAGATTSSLANRIGDRPSDKRFARLSLEAFDRIFGQNANPKMANFFLLQLLLIQNPHHQLSHNFTGGGETHAIVPEFTHLELGYVGAVAKAVKTLWGRGKSGCNEYRICPFIGICLASPVPEIRAIGRELAEWIYEHGNGTNRQLIRCLMPLPAEDNVTARAKADYRQLSTLHKFWEIVDGK